jgi:hypothetical protein
VIRLEDVPHDEILVGLRVAADADAMFHRLQPHFGAAVEILQFKVSRLAYKPRRSARLTYRLKLFDRERGRVVRHLLHGRVEALSEAAQLHRKMRKRDWTRPAYGPALLYLDDLGLVLWGFPNDPRLPGIETIAGPGAFARLVSRLPELQGLSPQRCDSTIVKYVPGKRLVMRHRIVGAGNRRTSVYTKTYAHDRGGAIHAVMRDLWKRARTDTDALACPEPLAFVARCNTLVLAALPGTAALATLHGHESGRAMAQAGKGLARLHAGPSAGLEAWTDAHEFENFLGAMALLERHDPELAPVVARVRSLVQAERAHVEPAPAVPIHTAFRFSQLLDFRGRLALVDFDGFRAGHPMCDVGSFTAHLLYMAAKEELPYDAAWAAARDFAAAYRGTAPWGTPPHALRWYTAVILVAKHAQKCVKRTKTDGDVKVRRLLDMAEALLAGRASRS